MELSYSDGGNLTRFDFRDKGEAGEELLKKVLLALPTDLDALEEFKKRAKGKLVEVQREVTFDSFWDAFGKKVNRARTEPLWNKLSDSDKAKCLDSVSSYIKCLERTGRYKQDPETYIRSRNFETNWNQVR